MKFIVDAQLPAGLCRWLKALGHEAVYSGQLMSGEAADREIARYAAETNMIVITKDQDFISLQLAFGHVVLWLRCGNMNNLDLYAWLAPRWAAIETALVKGDRLVEVRLIG